MAGTALTGRDGAFVIDGLADAADDVSADHESEGIAAMHGVRTDTKPTITLSGRGTIRGVVLTEDGAPLSSAFDLVATHPLGPPKLERRFQGGRFALEAIDAGRIQITVQRGERLARADVDLRAGQTIDDLVIRLPPVAMVALVRHQGRPVAGALVLIACRSRSESWLRTTDDTGRFRVEPHPACPIDVAFYAGLQSCKATWPDVRKTFEGTGRRDTLRRRVRAGGSP